MADIVFDCPSCGESVQVDAKGAGQSGTCPYCNGNITVPASQPAMGSSPQPESMTANRPPHAPPPPPSYSRRPIASRSQPATAMRRTNGQAIAGLILGILSIVISCLGIVLGLTGLILSSKALSQINKHPGEQEGKGLAIAGLITSIVGLTLGACVLLYILFTLGMAATFFAAFAALLDSLFQTLPTTPH